MNVFTFTLFFKGILLANSADPDQTLQNTASELGLHCLHISPKRVSSLERVNLFQVAAKIMHFSTRG